MHKRNVIAMLCTAVVAVGIVLSLGYSGAPEPESALPELVPIESGDHDGALDTAVDYAEIGQSDEQASEVAGGSPSDEPEYVPGVVLVKIDEGYSIDQVNEQLAGLDYITTPSISEDDLVYGYVELELAEGVGVDEASAMLAGVDFASASQPNYVYHLLDDYAGDSESQSYTPSEDPSKDGLLVGVSSELSADIEPQTTIINDKYSREDAADAEKRWMLEAINAYAAWDYARANNTVTVAVLDSGLNVDHEDLAANVVGAYSVINDNDPSDVTDSLGHGTHVAGIIGATANNEVGVAGVSYNANIMPVQVIKSDGSVTTGDALRGIEYIIEHKNDNGWNVRVVNMSFGGPYDGDVQSGNDTAFLTGMNNLHKAKILVVCAAGNYADRDGHVSTGATTTESAYKCFPCDFDPNALGVINLTHSGTTYWRATGSNYNMADQTVESTGAKKDLAAPGTGIYSTLKSGGYGNMSGTSMASPCVAGVAALLFAANPSLKPDDVKTILCDTATDLNSDENLNGTKFDLETGYGLVNAEAALKAAVPDAAPILSGESLIDPLGDPIMLSITNGGLRTWSWSSSDDTVATVADGQVTGRKAGVATIYATSDDIVLSLDVTVVGVSLSAATVEFGTCTYDGTEQMPQPTVRIGSTTLTYGVDYTVSYPDDCTNAGTKAVTITALDSGIVEGSTSASYTISKRKLTLTAKSSTKVYDGTVLSASDVGYSAEGLVKESDLSSVTLSGSITNVGSTTSRVSSYTLASGMAQNYSVTKVSGTLGVTAAPLSNCTVLLSSMSYTYDGRAKEPTVTVELGSKTLTKDADYTVSYSNNINVGTATVTVNGKGNYSGTVKKTFDISASKQSMYRLYNPNSGEHFYTSSITELNKVVYAGWTYEGIGWKAPSTSNTPVYRLYNKYGGEHHYTTSKAERDKLVNLGWKYEGIGWYSDDAKGVPLYRLYNPNAFANNHHYTTSKAERDKLVGLGWKDEGYAWYGMK